MDNALYVSLSRQLTLQRSLDVTANNLANVDTAGFKVESLVVNTDPLATPAPANSPIQYVLDTQVARNFSSGPIDQTGNPYDMAVEGDGFVTVQTASGPRYTRDGRFSVDSTGALVDKAGDAVLSSGGSPIVFDVKKAIPSVGRDGTISQDGVQVGKLAVVKFANRGLLSKEGDNTYSNDPSNTPIPATDSTVLQGAVEHSNVQAVSEITRLITIQRSYERIADIMSSTTDLSRNSIDRLGKVA